MLNEEFLVVKYPFVKKLVREIVTINACFRELSKKLVKFLGSSRSTLKILIKIIRTI